MSDTGYYHLGIRVRKELNIEVGSLGLCRFPSGYYIYTGSGGNGLRARVGRHFYHPRKRLHWHIDYLVAKSDPVRATLYYEEEIKKIYEKESDTPQQLECFLNEAVAGRKGAKLLVSGFGSSDCSCESHLVYLEKMPAQPCRFWPGKDGEMR